MNASDTSPSKGNDSDGVSYEETVRQLLSARLDRIEGNIHSAVVDADREIRSGGDLVDALDELEDELVHQRLMVELVREKMPEDDE